MTHQGRRWQALAAVALAALMMTACGGSSNQAGEAAAPGVTKTEIHLSETLGLTGNFAVVSGPYVEGAKAVFNKVNGQGGINGRKIVWDPVDDGYTVEQAVTLAQKMVNQNQILAAALPFGTAPIAAKAPIYNRAQIPYFEMGTGASVENKYPGQFGCLSPYFNEIQAPITYVVKNRGAKSFGVLVTNASDGTSVQQGAEKALTTAGLKPAVELTYVAGTSDFSGQLSQLRNVDYVVVFGSTPDTARILVAAKRSGIRAQFIGALPMGDPTLIKLAGDAANGGIVGSPLFPLDSDSAAMQQFRKGVVQYGGGSASDATLWALAGYHCASVLVEGLRKAGPNLTRSSFVQGMESIKKYETGVGPAITYSKTEHSAAAAPIAVLEIQNGKYVVVSG